MVARLLGLWPMMRNDGGASVLRRSRRARPCVLHRPADGSISSICHEVGLLDVAHLY